MGLISHSKGSEFGDRLSGNTGAAPNDSAQVQGNAMKDVEDTVKAKMDAVGSIGKSPRLMATPKFSTGPRSRMPSFPLLSENERKAP